MLYANTYIWNLKKKGSDEPRGRTGIKTSLVVQWLRIRLPMQGMRVPFLVGELRSHMPRGN